MHYAPFVTGWNSLPVELKVRILSYPLALTKISRACCQWGEDLTFNNCDKYYHLLLKPFLKTDREMFALAQEVYYRDNVFVLHPSALHYRIYIPTLSNDSSPIPLGPSPSFVPDMAKLCFIYPKAPLNNFIRNVQLELRIDECNWKFLQRVADGSYGFDNLTRVDVKLNWGGVHTLPLLSLTGRDEAMFPIIRFQAQGTLVFEIREYGTRGYFELGCDSDELPDEAAWLGERIEFGVKETGNK